MTAPTFVSSNETDPIAQVSVFVVMLFVISSLIIRSFVNVEMIDAGYDAVVAKNLSALVGFGVLAILLWPVLIRIWPAMRPQFRWPAFRLRFLLASVALGITFWLAQMLALALLTPLRWTESGHLTQPAFPDYSFSCANPVLLMVAIPVMALITPVFEEIVHRAIILRALLRKGRVVAILFSSALFAVVHSPGAMANAFLFGIFFAIQFLHYRTVWAPVITHGVANLMIVISVTCVNGYWLPGNVSWSVSSPTSLLAASLMACLVIAWWLAGRIEVRTESPGPVPT